MPGRAIFDRVEEGRARARWEGAPPADLSRAMRAEKLEPGSGQSPLLVSVEPPELASRLVDSGFVETIDGPDAESRADLYGVTETRD